MHRLAALILIASCLRRPGQGETLEVVDVTTHGNGSPSAIPISITWHGHQFLDAARSDSMWKKAGSLITKTGVSMSFDVLKPLLTKLTMDQLGLGGPGPRH
ncbi:MAG TPA: DUF2513 domain-containing protein [Acidobacteriaceae bacterium]|nr:DUF2513 domain-containing protein [Acidobacteriaceae bacterium]